MAKFIHTASGPNGEAFTRSSTSARYSHVLIGRRSLENDRARAERSVSSNAKSYREHVAHAAHGYEPSSWMIGKPVPCHYAERFQGCADLAQAFREEGRESSTRWLADKPATAEEYAEAVRVATHAEIDAAVKEGRYSAFVGLGWSGRHDLAIARFGEFQPTYCDLRAIPCTVAGKAVRS